MHVIDSFLEVPEIANHQLEVLVQVVVGVLKLLEPRLHLGSFDDVLQLALDFVQVQFSLNFDDSIICSSVLCVYFLGQFL